MAQRASADRPAKYGEVQLGGDCCQVTRVSEPLCTFRHAAELTSPVNTSLEWRSPNHLGEARQD